VALAPDGLFPVGGYPGNDDDGRALQGGLDRTKLRTDMLNSASLLKAHRLSNGKLGATGFCWGGGTVNFLAVTMGGDLQAGMPFYGAAAETASTPAPSTASTTTRHRATMKSRRSWRGDRTIAFFKKHLA
jgi:carboxymethylenebutenolidase